MSDRSREIRNKRDATALTYGLTGTGIEVVAGKGMAPFTVVVGRLGRNQVGTVIRAVKDALGREAIDDRRELACETSRA